MPANASLSHDSSARDARGAAGRGRFTLGLAGLLLEEPKELGAGDAREGVVAQAAELPGVDEPADLLVAQLQRLLDLAQLAIDPAFKEKAPATPLAVPGVLVASRTDPYAAWSHAENLSALWGLELADAGDAGHINAESGHGPWPEGLMRLAGLLTKI